MNDDDALDLFKKTLPSPSLLQMSRRAGDVRKEALALVRRSCFAWQEPQGALSSNVATMLKTGVVDDGGSNDLRTRLVIRLSMLHL